MKTVLVTGATGLVGGRLVRRLRDTGHRVIALTRRATGNWPAGVIERTVPPIETLDAAGWAAALADAEHVIHCAGIAHAGADVAEARYDAVNHRATSALAVAARRAGVRNVVFLSSIRAMTGASAPDVLTEASPTAPTDAYGRSKLAAENAIAASGVAHVILRPVVIVAPEARGNIATLRRMATTHLPLPLGALNGLRSLVAVEDVVSVAITALEEPAMAGGTFIVADPEPLTAGDMISLIREGLNRPPGVFPVPVPVLALAASLLGRGEMLRRLSEPLVAKPAALAALGLALPHGARRALRELALNPDRR